MEDFDLKGNIKFGLIISLTFVIIYLLFSLKKLNNFVVFCDVGQGDSVYIRVESVDILIDAGPSKEILNCLGNNMPFWDKEIEIAILSHPQKDHFGGYLYVIPRYKIDYFLMPAVEGEANSFKKLEELLEKENVEIIFPTAEDKIKIKSVNLLFFWPTKEFINSLPKKDLNEYSLVFKIEFKKTSILFTGDISKNVQDRLSQWAKNNSEHIFKTDIIKIPHHGSIKNLSQEFIKLANPSLALISVGKNNPYGHPSKETLNFLKALNIQIWRTDENGSLRINF